MMNQVFLMGVVDKVEDKTSDNGKPFKEVSIAYTEQGKDRDFKTWFRVSCYGKSADAATLLVGGETVVVTGKLYNAKRKSGEKTYYNLSVMANSVAVVGASQGSPTPANADDDIAF